MKNTFIIKFRNIIQAIVNSKIAKLILKYKKIVAILVMISFFVFFGFYMYSHPEIIKEALRIGMFNTLLIFVLYGGIILTNVYITYNTILLCHKELPLKNSIFLTIYSSVINFFGPLQSGPAVRAVYLKSKLKLKIRDYTYTMLFYYFAYAAINVSLLFVKNIPILTVLGIISAIVITVIGTNKLGLTSIKKYVLYIFISTAIQILFLILIYTIELNSIGHYNLLQTTTYAASANLSLFVSLTPGAIGIREAFLLLSQSIHNIPLSSIIAAGIIDRAIYVVFLISLLLLSSTLHLKNMFIRKQKS